MYSAIFNPDKTRSMINTKASRPIALYTVKLHYESIKFIQSDVTFNQYADCWRAWLENCELKTLTGLDGFAHQDFTQGTSQAFDMFVLRHIAHRTIVTVRGDFQYHKCLGKYGNFITVDSELSLNQDMAVIISYPFSGTGDAYIVKRVLAKCNELKIPVLLDLAYWGISKNLDINLNDYPCITEVASSLSKPFFNLETHRVGIRFSREYLDDGVSMQNEVGMQNKLSMSLGVSYMNKFDADWSWNTLGSRYSKLCHDNNLTGTDCIIFAHGGEAYADHNRGPGVNRVCVSGLLAD
jgi:hypothetical protein